MIHGGFVKGVAPSDRWAKSKREAVKLTVPNAAKHVV